MNTRILIYLGLTCLLTWNCSSPDKTASRTRPASTQGAVPASPAFPDPDSCERVQAAARQAYASCLVQLKTQITGNSVPAENKRFIQALLAKSHDSVHALAIEAPLFPIFCLEAGQQGIFGFPVIETRGKDGWADRALEKQLLEKEGVNIADSVWLNRLRMVPAALPAGLPAVYVYGLNQPPHPARITSLGAYTGECLSYYRYSFDAQGLSEKVPLLFGSRFPLVLEYGPFPALDRLIAAEGISRCNDCPDSRYLRKAFARIQGTSLYFMYADTFPVSTDTLDGPYRSLEMLFNQHLVPVWEEEVDLFGCSCL